MFYQTCSELKKIFEEIAALKKDNTEKVEDSLYFCNYYLVPFVTQMNLQFKTHNFTE